MNVGDLRKLIADLPDETMLVTSGVSGSLRGVDARVTKAATGGFDSCGGSGNYLYESKEGLVVVYVK